MFVNITFDTVPWQRSFCEMLRESCLLLRHSRGLYAGREAALWEIEERHLLELGAEKKQHIQQLHDLLRRQLAFRRAQVCSLCW